MRESRCARCGGAGKGKRLPFGWHRRGDDHVCRACWLGEPAERQSVRRYDVLRGSAVIPDSFWRQQRAARLLWDELVGLSDRALAGCQPLRSRYAAVEAAAEAPVGVALAAAGAAGV